MIRINSYRIGVGIILLNEEKKVFVGKRIDIKSEAWQMPQGGINKDEKMENAAYRELYEETGIKKAKRKNVVEEQNSAPIMHDILKPITLEDLTNPDNKK